MGGLHADWKKRAQLKPQTAPGATSITARQTTSSSATTTGMVPTKSRPSGLGHNQDQQGDRDDGAESPKEDDGEELGVDDDDEALEAMQKEKQTSGGEKKVHKGGTKAVHLVSSSRNLFLWLTLLSY